MVIAATDLQRFAVCLVKLNPVVGSEICKTRPCVIISPDEINRYLKTIIVAPMTTKGFAYPTRVSVRFQNKKGWVLLDQIRTVDKLRVDRLLGTLKPVYADAITALLQEMFSL